MRRFLLVLALILVGVAYFRGWFQVTTSKSQNNLNFGVTVESDKIEQDTNQVRERVDELGQKVNDSNR